MSHRALKGILRLFAGAAVLVTATGEWASCRPGSDRVQTGQSVPPSVQQTVSATSSDIARGRSLFLKNCAHCHGADARGDDGPDLHEISESDDWIARRIRNGVKGEMTAFGGKFSPEEIGTIIAYLRTLK